MAAVRGSGAAATRSAGNDISEGLAEGAERSAYLESVASARPDAEERLSDARGRIEGLPSVPTRALVARRLPRRGCLRRTWTWPPCLSRWTFRPRRPKIRSSILTSRRPHWHPSVPPPSIFLIDSDVALDADEVTMFDLSTAPSTLFSDEGDETMDAAACLPASVKSL